MPKAHLQVPPSWPSGALIHHSCAPAPSALRTIETEHNEVIRDVRMTRTRQDLMVPGVPGSPGQALAGPPPPGRAEASSGP